MIRLKKGTMIVLAAAMIAVMAGCGAKEKIGSEGNVTTGAGGGKNTNADANAGKKDNSEPEKTDNAASGNESTGDEGAGEDTKQVKSWSEKPAMTIDTSKSYSATFKTNKGDFTVQLYAKEAPETVNSFVFLAGEKFYDGIRFHRIIESFMIQSGDPVGNGTGGPGYNIPDELNNGFEYEEGTLAMANTGQPDSGGSQFFIGTGPDIKGLNNMPNYTIFGKVNEEDMEVVKKIAQTPVEFNGREASSPTEEVTINSVEITVE